MLALGAIACVRLFVSLTDICITGLLRQPKNCIVIILLVHGSVDYVH